MKKMSIIIPVYNEETVIEDFFTGLFTSVEKLNAETEIIVINDGSQDSSQELLKNHSEKILLRNHDRNRGYGASIKTGLREAKYDYILIIDADGSYRHQDIEKLVENISVYDMVVGARIGKNASHNLIRRPAKWILRKLAEYISSSHIPDLNSGLRIFKKEIALKYMNLFPDGFSFTTTITLIMLCNNYNIKFEPIDYLKRTGKSKIRPIRDTANFVGLILRMTLYFNPVKIFGPISLVLIIAGISVAAYQAIAFRNISTSTIVVFLTGVQVGMLGLLADLIDKRS